MNHQIESSRTVQLAWGMNAKGELVHIDRIQRGHSQLVCPGCLAPLIAVKGFVKAAHFRHSYETGRACHETAAHLLAKQILLAERELKVPDREYATEILQRGWLQSYESATVEPWLADLSRRPDISLDLPWENAIGSVTLHVEIHVHHSVDEAKVRDFRKAGLTALEIKIEAAIASLNLMEATNMVVRSAPRKWLSDPFGDSLRVRAKEKHEIEQARLKKAYEEALYREKQQSAERLRRKEIWLDSAFSDLQNCKSVAESFWESQRRSKSIATYLHNEGLDYLISTPVDGDIAFNIAPEEWRASVLFELYIKPIDAGATGVILPPDAKAISSWLKRNSRLFQGKHQMFKWRYGDEEDVEVFKRYSALREFFENRHPFRHVGTPWYVCQQVADFWDQNRSLLKSWDDRNRGRGLYC